MYLEIFYYLEFNIIYVDIFLVRIQLTAMGMWTPLWYLAISSMSYGKIHISLHFGNYPSCSSILTVLMLADGILNSWFLLLGFLEVIIILKTATFPVLYGPFYLEILGSSIWISNNYNWKHSELYKMLNQVWDIVGKDSMLIWGLPGISPWTLNCRLFHKPAIWYHPSQFLDQVRFVPPQYLELPGIIMPLLLTLSRESLSYIPYASIKWERNSLHAWIHGDLTAGFLLRARERWFLPCLSCSHTSHCSQSSTFLQWDLL